MTEPFTDVEQTNVDCSPSAIASEGHLPVIVSGALLWLVRNFFVSEDIIMRPSLRGYVWNAVPEQSKIYIGMAEAWNPKTVQQRPAVLIKRNLFGSRRYVIGDAEKTGSPESFSRLLSYQYGIICISKSSVECEELATEVYFKLMQLSPVIKDDLGLGQFDALDVGSMTKIPDAQDCWQNTITVGMSAVYGWTIQSLEPLISGINLRISTE